MKLLRFSIPRSLQDKPPLWRVLFPHHPPEELGGKGPFLILNRHIGGWSDSAAVQTESLRAFAPSVADPNSFSRTKQNGGNIAIMRAARLLRSALLILILGIFSCPFCLACGCIGSAQSLTTYELVKQSVDLADLVFSGAPTTLHGDGKSQDTDDLVVFEVEQVFKGTQSKRIGVHSGIGTNMMSSCGYWFEIGKAYLVFARQFGDHFVVAACSYTAPLEKSGTAIRLLEKQPQQPDDLLTPAQIQRNSKGRIFGTVRRADGGPLFRADIYVWNESDSSYERPGWPNDEEWRPDKSGDSAAFLLARATSVEKDGLFQSDLLNPGRYRITAVDSSYGPTRWVGAFSIRADDTAPAPVQVTAGRDYRWADIVLHEQKVFALEGIIRSSDGSPLPLKDITIRATMAPGEMFPLLEYFYPDSAGEFILERCPVGRVRLAVSVLQRGGSVWAPATAEVEVNGDTSEVEIVLTRNAGLPAPETQKSQDDERPAPH